MDANLFHRAVIAFLEYGPGAVVVLFDDPQPIYVRADEAVALLSEWRAEPAIIGAVAQATADYDKEQEAVVVREDTISFTLTIERHEETKAVENLTWSALCVARRARASRRGVPHRDPPRRLGSLFGCLPAGSSEATSARAASACLGMPPKGPRPIWFMTSRQAAARTRLMCVLAGESYRAQRRNH